MWRQLVASITAMALGWSPLGGVDRAVIPGRGGTSPAAAAAASSESPDPNVRGGKEAVLLAMDRVVQLLVDHYYSRHGGLFVTRGRIERRIRQEFEKREQEISGFIRQRFLCDNVPIRFNVQTAQVIFSQRRHLQTLTVAQIATSLIESHRELQ